MTNNKNPSLVNLNGNTTPNIMFGDQKKKNTGGLNFSLGQTKPDSNQANKDTNDAKPVDIFGTKKETKPISFSGGKTLFGDTNLKKDVTSTTPVTETKPNNHSARRDTRQP